MFGAGVSATLLLLCLGALVLIAIPTLIVFVLKLGVIIQKSQEPPHRDTGTYELDQGREVRSERDQ